MKNEDIVSLFVETLLQNPEMTMQAVAMRLSTSRYELKLLKAEPFLEFDVPPHLYQMPCQEQMLFEERSVY